MERIRVVWAKLVRISIKHWFVMFAVALYFVCTAFYMGPGFYKCTDSIYGFGDSTAGPIWRNTLRPEQPLFGGHETSTNFPKGESLHSPVNYAAAVQTVSMRAGSKVFGPVCAYNVYNILGYLSTALVMLAFVYYLTRSRWIALIAGYAAAFTPYAQSKVGGHPSYGYTSLLIAVLWLTIHLLVYRRKLHAFLLAILLSVCMYFDPYFILLSATIVFPVVTVFAAIFLLRHRQRLRTKLRELARSFVSPLMIITLVFALLVSPIVFIRFKNASDIEKSVGGVRGDVTAAAAQCSNRPIDYILPDPNNKHLINLFGPSYSSANIQHRNWCGYGESRVSISLTAMIILATGAIIWGWEKANGRRLRLHKFLPYHPKPLLYSLFLVGIAAIYIGMPPRVHGVITGSGLILKITEMWRIFAREFLVINAIVIVLFAVMLKYFSSSKAFADRKWLRAGLFIMICVSIMAEYQINNAFSPPTFSYSRDIPSVYETIRQDSRIKVIAEYPLDRMGTEYDSIVYYLTMQAVHKKKIFNSAVIPDPSELIHLGMKDLSDPQTIPALRYLGIDYFVIHGQKPEDVRRTLSDVQTLKWDNPVVYGLRMVRNNKSNDIVLVRSKPGHTTSNILALSKGYVVNLPLIASPISMEYETAQDAVLKVVPLKQEKVGATPVCFDAKMSAPTDVAALTIYANGNPVMQTPITGVYERIRVMAKTGDTLRLHTDKGYNIRLDNLDFGCRGQ